MPEPSAPRKHSRLGLYGPFVLLGIFMALWSAAWVWARGETLRRIDAGAEQLRRAGYEVEWKDRRLGGYPFRLDVTLTEVRLRDRSGWALESPALEAEAYMHAVTSWVIAAPQGLTFVRPKGGPVEVTGRLIRASLSHFDNTPPNVSFEGADLRFRPSAGAEPFSLSAADRVEFHLRQAPAAVGDEGGVWLTVTNGKAQLAGLLGRIAGGKPISIAWDSRISHVSAFQGASWPDAVRRWTAAGGRMNVKRAGLTAGDALIGADAGTLTVGSDGRIRGVLQVSLKQAPRALGALGASGAIPPEQAEAAAAVATARQGPGEVARATLNFEAGRTTLGPVAIAPAPMVYDPR